MAEPITRTAADLKIVDSGAFYASDNVEGALQEAGGGGGPALYTTVVTTPAELLTALTTPSGDTFITPGHYLIDITGISAGPLDTTPRRFVGAGREADGTGPYGGNGVTIELTAGGGSSELDFGASLTEVDGVEWENVQFVSSAPIVGPALLAGCLSVKNVRMNGLSTVAQGLRSCKNVVNCNFSNGGPGSVGFLSCDNVMNCTVGDPTPGSGAESGFIACLSVVNGKVFYEPGGIGAFLDAFAFCDRLVNCLVDATPVASVAAGTFRAARLCDEVVNFTALGPAGGPVGSMNGIESCERISNCFVANFDINYTTNVGMTDCESVQGTGVGSGQHFIFCERLKGCHVDGTGDDPAGVDGFENCGQVSDCRAENTTGHGFDGGSIFTNCRATSPAAAFSGFNACFDLSVCRTFGGTTGYQTCEGLSSCRADSAGTDGFNGCGKLSACHAENCVGDGYDACVMVSACLATLNTGFGYRDCSEISSSQSNANTAGTDTGSVNKSAASNNF